jgi:hypothetical protein
MPQYLALNQSILPVHNTTRKPLWPDKMKYG